MFNHEQELNQMAFFVCLQLMKEKSVEIKMFVDLLNSKKRALANGVAKVKMELMNVQNDIETLKTKYFYVLNTAIVDYFRWILVSD